MGLCGTLKGRGEIAGWRSRPHIVELGARFLLVDVAVPPPKSNVDVVVMSFPPFLIQLAE
jgi:hypothetical protein